VSDGATAPRLVAVKASDPLIGGRRREASWPERIGRALDPLPWPTGENLLAGLGVLDGLARPSRLRQALDWASAQPRGRHGRWGLTLRLLANHGRFIAQEHLVGVRDPTTLRERVRVTGEEHLAAAGQRATILLGFHVGPPRSSLVLRLLGYPVTSMHDLVYRPPERPKGNRWAGWRATLPMERQESAYRVVTLRQARRHLVNQGWLYIAADGPPGAEAYRISLPGGPVIIREGWLALRRLTGAMTLPVLAHLEGRHRMITIHPPLPPVSSDSRADAKACRLVLTDLLCGYLHQFPEQCRATVWRP
jgi:lauroyl/myristoyl acyltransferase